MLRTLALVALFAAVIASIGASAATLGGVTSGTIGANTVAVTACDTDGVTTSYTTAYDATLAAYEVTSVTVSGINVACDGGTVFVTLAKTDNTVLGTGTLSQAIGALSTSETIDFSAT